MALEGYMRVTEAAVVLGVTTRRIRQLIEVGVLSAEALSPRMYLVGRASVESYQRTRRPVGRPRRRTRRQSRQQR